MPLAAAALLPSLVTQLNDIGGNIPAMTLADLITSEIAGYDLSMPAPKSPMLDFRWPRPIAAALASDCNRFSCAAFQSVAEVSSEMEKRDSFPWTFIKLYYAAFYAAHALVRTLGEGCSFFYKRHTDRIAVVADANGFLPPVRIDAGLYRCVLNGTASTITYNKAASSSGGTHEAFWLVFGNKLRSVADAILVGPLPTADAQTVYAQIDQMLQILNRKSNYGWLTGVRNDLQYKLQHGVWFPEITKVQFRRDLGRVAEQWKRDPMKVSLMDRRWGLLGDFTLTCVFIIALCREVFGELRERSSLGKRSFVTTGPLAYLSDRGMAA